jgi:hypothetical protein
MEEKGHFRPTVPVTVQTDFKSNGGPHGKLLEVGHISKFMKFVIYTMGTFFTAIGVAGFMAIVYLLLMKTTGIDIDTIFAIVGIGVITAVMLYLGPYGLLLGISWAPSKLFEDGIIPQRQKIEQLFIPPYFIPFRDILRVGRVKLKKSYDDVYYFLMTDGKIAKCHLCGDSKVELKMINVIQRDFPKLEWVDLDKNEFEEGIGPVRYFADPKNERAIDFEMWTPMKKDLE